jgi:hypothetical protein
MGHGEQRGEALEVAGATGVQHVDGDERAAVPGRRDDAGQVLHDGTERVRGADEQGPAAGPAPGWSCGAAAVLACAAAAAALAIAAAAGLGRDLVELGG